MAKLIVGFIDKVWAYFIKVLFYNGLLKFSEGDKVVIANTTYGTLTVVGVDDFMYEGKMVWLMESETGAEISVVDSDDCKIKKA